MTKALATLMMTLVIYSPVFPATAETTNIPKLYTQNKELFIKKNRKNKHEHINKIKRIIKNFKPRKT